MEIDARIHDGVCEIRLNRPARLNALSLSMTHALSTAVQDAQRSHTARVVLIVAEGRAFCAGKDRDEAAGPDFVDALQALTRLLMNGPKPVVAAVQGWAVGAGLELLLNCDIVVAGAGARFMLPEVNARLLGTGGILALLPRHVGMARAKGALMLGREFSAAQAEAWGLIWSVVPDDTLRDEARRLALQLAGGDAAILAATKAGLHRELFADLEDALQREAALHRRLAPP